jgi:hypothetical protein
MRNVCWLTVFLSALLAGGPGETAAQTAAAPLLIEDFDGYEAGVPPYHWKLPHKKSRTLQDLPRVLDRDVDYFEIVEQGGSKRVRAYTKDESTQIMRLNGDGYQWDLRTHPRLSWQWQARQLPAGAREDKSKYNDAGAALYVTFDSKDWLGRPRSIKYTYSSTLPVGTTARYGALRVIVAASGADGYGDWVRVERDVLADYQRLFDREPPDLPAAIMLWGDSDDTDGVSDVLFDNIEALPAR